MPNLSPGPFTQLSPNVSAVTSDPNEFAALVSDHFAGLPPVESELDAFLVGLGNTPTPSLLDELNAHVEAMDAGLADIVAVDPEDGLTTVQQQNDAILLSLDEPHRDLPAEAYQRVPAPQFFEGTSGPFPGISGPTTLQFSNLTRGGTTDFYPGDQVQITVTISSGGGNFDYQNVDIWIIRYKDGVEVPVLDIGPTDNNGNVTYRFVVQANDVGSWEAYTLPLGQGPDNLLTYTVHPSTVTPPPPPPPTYTRSVQFSINGVVGATQGHLFDSFLLHFTGAPGELVEIAGTKDGVSLGPYITLGFIGPDGTFDDEGGWSGSQFYGNWTETYRIGGVQLPTVVTFTVGP